MLLLKEGQIQFQEVINPEHEQPEPFLGVFYQDKLFKKLKSFPKDRLESAQQFTRQLSLDPRVACLMLEGDEKYTVWYQDTNLRAYDASQVGDWISKINLKELVREMRDIGGIKIKDRRYRLNIYPRCMVGSEASTWLMRRFSVSDIDAVKLGQRLIDENLLHHVTDSHPFEDGFFFYRFYWDE
jgi:Domain found in Dishevelled, Egl-10, and Pleckstrin (DEP)